MTVFSRVVLLRLIGRIAIQVCALCAFISPGAAQTSPADPQIVRDPWLRPFSADSIWNTPLGSNAIFADANLQNATIAGSAEVEWLIRTGPMDAFRQTYYPGDTQVKRATGTTPTWIGMMRLPDSLIIPDVQGVSGQPGYSAPNDGAAFLEANGYSLIHLQPATRLTSTGPIWGFPQRDYGEPGGGNLFGPGKWGAHYGSGLSVIGGSIRVGELTAPDRDSIRHALKILVWMGKYSRYTTLGDGNAGWRWPAKQADSYANPAQYSYGYGTVNGGANANPEIEQGTLLALEGTVNIDSLGLTSEKAKKIAWTLQNYGGYIVDDTFQDQYAIGVEKAASADFDISLADINTIFRSLKVVTNNSSISVGGGGIRRVGPPPRFAYGGGTVGVFAPIPGRIEAENYDVGGPGTAYSDSDVTNNGGIYRVDSVDLEPCSEGGFDLTAVAPNEWVRYGVSAATAGSYNVTFRYAGPGGALRINNASGTNLAGTVTLPPTAGYQAWQSKTVTVTLPAGNQSLFVNFESSGFNLNYIDFTNAPLVNRATGGTATASSNPIAGEVALKAFDGDSRTKWLGAVGTGTTKAWLQYQFASGNAYAVQQYTITSANDYPTRDPRNWEFQGSNDGSSWVRLDVQNDQIFSARYETKTYTLSNTTPFRYYRLAVTAINGASQYTQLSEMKLLGP